MLEVNKETSAFIQIWRGLAVLLVVLYHFTDRIPHQFMGSPTPPLVQEQIGKIGILIFFVISGYLITKSLMGTKDVAAFYAKRISRIWPLFIVASITVYIAMKVLNPPVVPGEYSFYEESRSFMDLIGSLFFLNDLGFEWMDGAYWSILVELKFYFFIGMFAVVFKDQFVRVFCITALVLSSVDFLILIVDRAPGRDLAFDSADRLRPISAFLHGILISQYLPYFAVGVAMAGRLTDGLLASLIGMAVVMTLISLRQQAFVMDQNVLFVFLVAAFVALDYFLLQSRVFLWIGNYSYSIYLFHQMVGLSITKMLTPAIGIDLAILSGLTAITLIAWVASVLFENRYRQRVGNLLYRFFSILKLNRLTFDFSKGLNNGLEAKIPAIETG